MGEKQNVRGCWGCSYKSITKRRCQYLRLQSAAAVLERADVVGGKSGTSILSVSGGLGFACSSKRAACVLGSFQAREKAVGESGAPGNVELEAVGDPGLWSFAPREAADTFGRVVDDEVG